MYDTKYMYNGISLRKYCLNNYLNYDTILKRINTIKNNNGNLSTEEVIDQAINNTNTIYKLMYKGVPLIKFCGENNIRYNTLLNYIYKTRKNNSNLTDDAIVDSYIEIKHKRNSKYMYNGITLREYCKQYNINYMNILKFISKYKQNKNNPEISDDELVLEALNIYTEIFYKGISLKIYCEYKKKYKYNEIKNYILRRRKDNPNITDDELIDEYIKIKYKRNGKHMYNGMLLTDYCKLNNLNVDSIRKSIDRYKNNNKYLDLTDEQIVQIVIENKMGIQTDDTNNTIETHNNSEIIKKPIEEKKKRKITKEELLERVRDLPRDDLEFIILKYQHNYSNMDLAQYFNISLLQVIDKDKELLLLLKNKYKVKILTKKR